MAVKNLETNKVHKGKKGGETGCGFNTKKFPEYWVNSSSKITCNKDGCKN